MKYSAVPQVKQLTSNKQTNKRIDAHIIFNVFATSSCLPITCYTLLLRTCDVI